MARPRSSTGPAIYWQKQAAQFCADIDGRRYRLGTDRDEAEQKRLELLRRAQEPRLRSAGVQTVDGACAAYLDAVSGNYPLRSGQMFRIGTALKFVVQVAGARPAADFDSLTLKQVRQVILEAKSRRSPGGPLSRNYVNSLVGCVCTAWDWLASEKLVPAEQAMGMRLVKPLRAGFGGKETSDILPPSCEQVERVLPCLSPVVAVMVRLQRLTGMRPGELVLMRRCDVSTSPAEILRPPNSPPVSARQVGAATVWFYCPAEHKTRHRGKARVIALGPKAQALLLPYLDRPGFLFSPREGRRSWKGKPGALSPGARPGARYTTQSYGRSIRYACVRAGVPVWAPNQLRHALASEVADSGSFDLAADILGHSSPSTTAVYVSRLLGRLATHAAAHG